MLQDFHPTIARWFADSFGEPSAPQREGWPAIRSGAPCLIAAPTGSGKTLAAFLHALDTLLRDPREDAATRVLYISPLRALSNDVQKNLTAPLAALRELDPQLPEVRIEVRTGDTTSSERARMTRTPPDALVTTPESLYVLLSSAGGRNMLRSIETVIVDEIHALAGNKRGAHLALTLERLDLWLTEGCGLPRAQRIGLSATQKPLSRIADFLIGAHPDRARCRIVEAGGHRRELDIALEIPDSPLEAVCADETWDEIHRKLVGWIGEHRTTLVFANTRKMAERTARRLTEVLGSDVVTSHHGSLSFARRLDAEQRLKNGELRALCATASLELGIDIGDIDLVVQLGMPDSIATFLQRVGRAGHGIGRVPKGRLVALTKDEAVSGAALLRAVRRGELDEIRIPEGSLDILVQQVVATCAQNADGLGGNGTEPDGIDEDALFAMCRRAWPFRELDRTSFDAAVRLHAQGRLALLHRDGVRGRLRATKRARLPVLTSGGAIPDTNEVELRQEADGDLVGTVSEDFAIESSIGDVFQFGNTSWQIVGFDRGRLRVRNAGDRPSTLPFWFGEAPARSAELSAAVSSVRELGDEVDRLADECGIPAGAARQIADHIAAVRAELGVVPSQTDLVLERFFDDTGGMQLVLHSPFGSRINRALGLALRKRFCRGFGFELQAAADEDAIVLSLGPMHSFPLEDVFEYLHPSTARKVLEQALLPTPMFKTRWRWNVGRALVVPRFGGGKKVPPPILRARADDALAAAFPEIMACGETLPPGDFPIPDHPLVQQTIEDCLHEAMDVDGMITVLRGLRDGTIRRHAVDRHAPSAWAATILAARPYAFLDDAPLEERRTAAVRSGSRGAPPFAGAGADTPGDLDPDVVHRVREEAWPDPASAEECHEALTWMGYVESREAPEWLSWLEELRVAHRVERIETRGVLRWYAVEAPRQAEAVLRGRLEALGPVRAADEEEEATLRALEARGEVFRARLLGETCWCNRRLLARIHAAMRDARRPRFEPLQPVEFLAFRERWQHATEAARVPAEPGPVAALVRQLAGTTATARVWEAEILARRVEGGEPAVRRALDELGLRGEIVQARLWGQGNASPRTVRISIVPRTELVRWRSLGPARAALEEDLGASAHALVDALRGRGASFADELAAEARLLPSQLEEGLAELVGRGIATCDSVAALRALLVPAARRRPGPNPALGSGRWSLLPDGERAEAADTLAHEDMAEFVFDRLIDRHGVVFRRMLLQEPSGVLPPWRDLVRVGRRRELEGRVLCGRFVAGRTGEQFAAANALAALRAARGLAPAEDLPSTDPAAAGTLFADGEQTACAPSGPTAVPAGD